jgi:hypothetical protein
MFQTWLRGHGQSFEDFSSCYARVLEMTLILDKGAKIKEKEKNRKAITQKIHAKVFGAHKHELRSKFDA